MPTQDQESQTTSYKPWTKEEIAGYQPVKSEILMGIYAAANLLLDCDPERRAKYLAEEFAPGQFTPLQRIDHQILMLDTAKEGRPAELNQLERLAIEFVKLCAEKSKKQI